MTMPGKSSAGPHQAPVTVAMTPLAKTTVPIALSLPLTRCIGNGSVTRGDLIGWPQFVQTVALSGI